MQSNAFSCKQRECATLQVGVNCSGGRRRSVARTGRSRATFSTADIIRDFSSTDADKINLGFVDANSANGAGTNEAFAFIGTNAFHNVAGELRYEQVSGDIFVYGDTNGDGIADFMIRLDGLTPSAAETSSCERPFPTHCGHLDFKRS